MAESNNTRPDQRLISSEDVEGTDVYVPATRPKKDGRTLAAVVTRLGKIAS